MRRARSTAPAAPAMARAPEQERPKRVGSSLLNMTTSMERRGAKPARRSAATASTPPSTPTTPSKRPLSGMASVCDPVPTAGSDGSLPTQRPKMVPNESSLRPGERRKSHSGQARVSTQSEWQGEALLCARAHSWRTG